MVREYIFIGSPVAVDFQYELNFSSMLIAIFWTVRLSNLTIETEIEHAKEVQLLLEMKGYRATFRNLLFIQGLLIGLQLICSPFFSL